jgi:hypothetical protein
MHLQIAPMEQKTLLAMSHIAAWRSYKFAKKILEADWLC